MSDSFEADVFKSNTLTLCDDWESPLNLSIERTLERGFEKWNIFRICIEKESADELLCILHSIEDVSDECWHSKLYTGFR